MFLIQGNQFINIKCTQPVLYEKPCGNVMGNHILEPAVIIKSERWRERCLAGDSGGGHYGRILDETDRFVICKWPHPKSAHFLSQHGRASSNNEPLQAAYLVCPAGPPSIPA